MYGLYQVVIKPLDKGHVPKYLWKLSVTYLFEDTAFLMGDYSMDFIIILVYYQYVYSRSTMFCFKMADISS